MRSHCERSMKKDPGKSEKRLTFSAVCVIISVTILGHNADFHRICRRFDEIPAPASGFVSVLPILLQIGYIHAVGFGNAVSCRAFFGSRRAFLRLLRFVKNVCGRQRVRNVAIANAFGCVPPRLSASIDFFGRTSNAVADCFASYYNMRAADGFSLGCTVCLFLVVCLRLFGSAFWGIGSGRESHGTQWARAINCARSKPRKPGCCEMNSAVCFRPASSDVSGSRSANGNV